MCEFIKIKDFGPNDKYIINKDLEEDRSVTIKELSEIIKCIFKEHRSKPDSKHLNLFFFACHGIDKNSI